MSKSRPFPELMARVRAGDEQAATELVRLYEPAIRRAVRVRLLDTRLQRLLDSLDVCQSVLASFFLRAAAGQYDLDRPEQLLKLLATMARNKVISEARRQQAECRDVRRLDPEGLDELKLVAAGATPSEQVTMQDLFQQIRRRLSEDERHLVDQRALGRDWPAIAADLGGSAEGLRKRLTRALDRVARELGLEV
jgi:RNA polymerase sigma-70 factor (ECF subfamily)